MELQHSAPDPSAEARLPPVPAIALASTDGRSVTLDGAGRRVVFAFPWLGGPGDEPPGGVETWMAIPGAKGCTAQACAYRDGHRDLLAHGIDVYGLSTQGPETQKAAVARLKLPYPLLSDVGLALTTALGLPTFEVAGTILLRRQTLIIEDGLIAAYRYPVTAPDEDAGDVLAWLRQRA